MSSSRFKIGVLLLSFLMTVYYCSVPIYLSAPFILMVTTYDVCKILDQVNYLPKHLVMMILYFLTGDYFFVSNYYSSRYLWLGQILVISASDIFQYLIGTRYGRRHVSSISPNKTLEGYFGSLLTLLFFPFFPVYDIIKWTIYGIAGGVLHSWLKRNLKIKDTSNLLGDHGGWLDRLDGIYFSLIVTSLLD
jgi:CDP-diglyceride synthetase